MLPGMGEQVVDDATPVGTVLIGIIEEGPAGQSSEELNQGIGQRPLRRHFYPGGGYRHAMGAGQAEHAAERKIVAKVVDQQILCPRMRRFRL